jgi:polynucleotide 5'-kinase involved in rRNA processing
VVYFRRRNAVEVHLKQEERKIDMDMLALKKAREKQSSSHSILIYGDSGCGKTRLAATAALIPAIERIVYLDLENGHDTILSMGLPDSALAKIQLFRICDTTKRSSRNEHNAEDVLSKGRCSSL